MTEDVDPLEHGAQIAMTMATGGSRFAEVMLREAQNAKLQQRSQTQANADRMAADLFAKADRASRFYGDLAADASWWRRATPADVGNALQGVHVWAENGHCVDEAAAMRNQVRLILGVDLTEVWQDTQNARAVAEAAYAATVAADSLWLPEIDPQNATSERLPFGKEGYDSADARDAREAALRAAGVPESAIKARVGSDQQNGYDPSEAAARSVARRTNFSGRPLRPESESDLSRGR